MRIKCLILLVLLFPAMCSAAMLIRLVSSGGGSSNLEVGYTSIGTQATSTNGLQIEVTVPDGGMTVTHGYFYGAAVSDTVNIKMAVYSTSGVHQGSCSSIATMSTSNGWWEVTFSPGIELSAGTYDLQVHVGGYYKYFYNITGTNGYGAGSCPTHYPNSTTKRAAMTMANYDAR